MNKQHLKCIKYKHYFITNMQFLFIGNFPLFHFNKKKKKILKKKKKN